MSRAGLLLALVGLSSCGGGAELGLGLRTHGLLGDEVETLELVLVPSRVSCPVAIAAGGGLFFAEECGPDATGVCLLAPGTSLTRAELDGAAKVRLFLPAATSARLVVLAWDSSASLVATGCTEPVSVKDGRQDRVVVDLEPAN